jgi:hypothetical protein
MPRAAITPLPITAMNPIKCTSHKGIPIPTRTKRAVQGGKKLICAARQG